MTTQRRQKPPRAAHGVDTEVTFAPPPGLGNRHLQSALANASIRKWLVARRCRHVLATAQPEVLTATDGVRLLGQFNAHPEPSADLVILLHGWEGGAESHYMVSAATALLDAGFACFRLNLRDHGGTHHLNEELFHSCRISEVVDAVAQIQRLHPARRTYLVGFSLGGNFALRVGLRAPDAGLSLEKIVALCPVLSPHSTMHALEQGLWIYREYFLAKWRRSLYRKAVCFPSRYDFGDLRRFQTLTATTDFFVQHYTPFPDLTSYLDGYSIVGDTLSGLTVPAEIIASDDDPVIPEADLVKLASDANLSTTITAGGGHCGFLEDFALTTWMDREVVRRVTPQV
jgi:predicted alpha/beta-fold hydrolase